MSLVINTNISSLNAQHNLGVTQRQLQTSMQRLSSGLRINSAADDAAGLAISTNMDAQVNSMGQAVRNANDGISLVQTAEGSLNETSNILNRMRELAVQSASGTVTDTQRGDIDNEFQKMSDEIDRIANVTSFNGQGLLKSASTFTIQVGTGTTSGVDTIDVKTGDATKTGLSIGSNDVLKQANATSAINAIDAAINSVSTLRGSLGAYQNRLTSTINNLQVAIQNTSSAESQIRDVDVASESASMTRANILTQAGVSVLAQANQAPQMALKLLG